MAIIEWGDNSQGEANSRECIAPGIYPCKARPWEGRLAKDICVGSLFEGMVCILEEFYGVYEISSFNSPARLPVFCNFTTIIQVI